MTQAVLKLFYTLLTDPLGLPIEPLWEYLILLIVGEVVHGIVWSASPGCTFGSLIYWVTKLIAFVLIWVILYALIAIVQFIIAYWIWFAVGAVILIAFVIWNCKN